MHLFGIFLQGGAGAEGGAGGTVSFLIPMLAMVVIIYFFMIRPQQKRQKSIQLARAAMKTGDKVIISGGIHGRIKEIADTNMLIEIAEGVRIRVDKASVFASSDDLQSKT